MRILIATSHRNFAGGVEKYLQGILPCLAQRGHELAFVYEYRFDPQKERVDSQDLGIPSCGIAEAGFAAAWRFVRDWKPEVVYSQGLESAGFQSVLLNEYPTVFYAHNYVGTCISGEKCHAFPSAQPCGRTFGPACLVLYYPRRCGGLNPITMWKMFERSAENHGQLQKYAAILVASAHMRREYERHGVSPDKIHLAALPNPSEGQESRAGWRPIPGQSSVPRPSDKTQGRGRTARRHAARRKAIGKTAQRDRRRRRSRAWSSGEVSRPKPSDGGIYRMGWRQPESGCDRPGRSPGCPQLVARAVWLGWN